MEKWVQIFKCIISHSSTKSLVPPLHKFTIRNLRLIFSLFWEKTLCTYWLVKIMDKQNDEKKILPSECRIAFCRLSIVRVKKVSLRGTSRMFFALYTGVSPPICSYYKLLADGTMEQGKVSASQWNKHPTLLIQKCNKK